MLARPEVGTREHVLLWLASKEGTFSFPDFHNCACAQYAREHGLDAQNWGRIPVLWDVRFTGDTLNALAWQNAGLDGLVSFAKLYEVARKRWK